ncbi:methyltransferase domain-containing protein [Simiduia sp. 21SJ11W-1]|uniref:class I SAM-dependent methyltransferase n=1 Tax=Simiduia sp. 21SJ11W-1 TaxID=2909669 RepID=UPI00209F88DD|nr:methyltransferase domain-containing protein [Simiduia sp. 21SJ11W-1]UTA47278.1 methyltransferase domain-containing protein [Simiduia sp. 21SJ11W-1]
MIEQNTREAFGLTLYTSAHKDIRKLRRAQGVAELHGNKLWKSSLVLMDYLRECPIEPGSRVLELGCGWGTSSVFCAKTFNAEVVALDADESVFPFVDLHAARNGVSVSTYCERFENLTEEDLSGFDVIIGADICFWDEMVEPLEQVLDLALAAEVGRIVLTDPGRPTFRALAEAINESYEDVIYTDWDVPEPHNLWGLVLDV